MSTLSARQPDPTGIHPAVITDVLAGHRLRLRRIAAARSSRPTTARLAHIAGYRPTVGDRVLVAGAEEAWVIAVLHTAEPQALRLPDGTRAELRDGGLELRDAEDRVLVRHADGCTEIRAATGDLSLSAPAGQVRLRAGTDVCVEANRDLTQRVGRTAALETAAGALRLELGPDRAHLKASRADLEAKSTRVATAKAVLIARSVSTTAERLVQHVEHYELRATKAVETVRHAFRTVTGLAQSRLGRARTVVRDVYSLHTRRTRLASQQDTTIDGDRIMLG